MKISDILKHRPKGVSFEFFPPKSAKGQKRLAATVEALKGYSPLYASMTYGAGGITQEQTKESVYMLLNEKKLVVMPHLTCIGASKDGVRRLLDEYREKGVDNIMALRGDPPQGKLDFDFSRQEFSYGRDLVAFIKQYGHFCLGVAVYPEGHIETSSLDEDTEYAKGKIDAGADFAVTQMFFDNAYFYALRERMKKKGLNIPVLPGILPLTNLSKVKEFASICRATIPKKIEDTIARYSARPEDQEKAGIDFTIAQCRDLIKNGAGQLHFFTLNRPEVMRIILDAII